MSNLSRRSESQPLSLREAMDRLIEDSFVRFGDGFGLTSNMSPAINLYESGDSVVVEAAVPGMKPEDLEITVVGDVLTIKGQTRREQEHKQASVHRQEWRYSSFERSLTLPSLVNADAAQTEFENGVLSLRLPKVEAAKAKRLEIKAKK